MLRLVTIPISHYCEKARWALERAAIPYREERHVQGVHRVAARRAGGGMTVPVLVTPERVLSDSADILEWVDGRTPPEYRLFPGVAEERREVEALCERLDAVLGPRGRRLMYVHMFTQRELSLEFNNQGVPGWEDRAIRYGWPVARGFVNRALGVRRGIEVEDEAAVWSELDHVAELRADGRRYLCGESFSAADLTFAALSAPMIVPPVYGVPLPPPERMSQTMAALVRRAREHPAGAYAMELFTEHRRRSVI